MSDESGRAGRITWRTLNLFASERFVITTALDDAEIHRRLGEVIERRTLVTRIFRLYARKDYLGWISAEGFQAEYVSIWLQLPPRVTGRFWNNGTHSLIEMKIRQQWGTIAVAIMVIVGSIYFIVLSIMGPLETLLGSMALALLFPVLFFIVDMIPYAHEVGRSKQFFRELLDDISVDQNPNDTNIAA